MPLQVRQQCYPGPSCTIACLLRSMHKTNCLVELKVYMSLYAVYNAQEPLFSGQREFVKM